MSILEAVLFGIVQGITEFLPISSTAHVILAEHLMGRSFPGLALEIFLHLASTLAVVACFRRELWGILRGSLRCMLAPGNAQPADRLQLQFALHILLATATTALLGPFLGGLVSGVMKTPRFMGLMLAVTGILLIFVERFHHRGRRGGKEMRILDAVLIGLGQALAILPGLSRSGSTLVAGLWVGLSRETAVRFSFLLIVPVSLGSSALSARELSTAVWARAGTLPLLFAFVSSFIFSLLGIAWLIVILERKRLLHVALYCFLLAGFLVASG